VFHVKWQRGPFQVSLWY